MSAFNNVFTAIVLGLAMGLARTPQPTPADPGAGHEPLARGADELMRT